MYWPAENRPKNGQRTAGEPAKNRRRMAFWRPKTARPALQGVGVPALRRIRPQGVTLRSVVEKPLQLLKLVSEVRILTDFALDFADRMQNGRVVAATETASDLRERTRR
jgi:hypothetical protein